MRNKEEFWWRVSSISTAQTVWIIAVQKALGVNSTRETPEINSVVAALSPKINTAPRAGKTEGAGCRPLAPAVNREDLAPSRGKERIVKGLGKELGKKLTKSCFLCQF